MSKLFARSLMVLALLFGLVFAVGVAVLYHYDFPVVWALGFAVVIVTLQFLSGPFIIDWIFKIRWVRPEEISPEFGDYLTQLCGRRGIRVPRFGIIEDGNPNAFTYGHTPGNARLVVTRGLKEMLNADEFNAVVAHEVGHIRHYDFIVMTFASLAPMLLYILYSWTRGSRRSGGSTLAVAIGAYISYIISQYIVLFLSRIREYYADEHAAHSVASANTISMALIKIAYGLARIPQPAQDPDDKSSKKDDLNHGRLMGSLGICSFSSATPMALYSTSTTGRFSLDQMMAAMQWDLWNPWAKFFEIQSTHPLIARRVQAASRIAQIRGERPTFPLSMPPKESYWREFATDVFFAALPYLGVALAVFGFLVTREGWFSYGHGFLNGPQAVPVSPTKFLGMPVLVIGIGWMIRLAYSYGSDFRRGRVADLVGEVNVSHIRGIPVELEGQIIGRGVPGLFWSKDLVMQDDSGFVTLIYRQPLSILETLFGWLKADLLVGRKGTFRGWYRRGPIPYLELLEARFEDGRRERCHYKSYLWVMAVITSLVGVLMMAMSVS